MNDKLNDVILRIIYEYTSSQYSGVKQDDAVYNTPIVGFSQGSDPLYRFLKKDIGDFYWTPYEAFSHEFGEGIENNLSVISFILPQTLKTRYANLQQTHYTSEEWAKNRLSGQKFINDMMKHVIQEVARMGIRSMAPTLNKDWKNQKSEKYGYASSWSERHAAYVSGLGTFGLSDGLITKRGKAHRCGSIIIEYDLVPTRREYNSHLEYCLYYKNGSCKACIQRCPANAITVDGHDKTRCRLYQRDILRPYIKKQYNLESSSCGLCQVGVPCEARIPT